MRFIDYLLCASQNILYELMLVAGTAHFIPAVFVTLRCKKIKIHSKDKEGKIWATEEQGKNTESAQVEGRVPMSYRILVRFVSDTVLHIQQWSHKIIMDWKILLSSDSAAVRTS